MRIRSLPLCGDQLHIVDDALEASEVKRVEAFCRALPFHRVRYGYRAAAEQPLGFGHQWIHGVAPDERPFLPVATVERLVRRLVGDVKPGRVHLNCVQPGDPRYPHVDDTTGRVLVAVYFANARWEERWAGELTFFEDGEPLYAIRPKPGRVLVFDGNVLHRGGVPSSDCPDVRYALACKFLRDDAVAEAR